jgi:hypothetical protein
MMNISKKNGSCMCAFVSLNLSRISSVYPIKSQLLPARVGKTAPKKTDQVNLTKFKKRTRAFFLTDWTNVAPIFPENKGCLTKQISTNIS